MYTIKNPKSKLKNLLPLLLLSLTACNSYNLRYAAHPQPKGAHVFADYLHLQDAIAFPIDTNGRRLEDVYVKKPDATILRPLNIAYPSFGQSSAIGTGIGVGTGSVGIGTGLSFPVGPETAHGLTTATFSDAALGPPPWELHVKLEGIEEATIPSVGGLPTAK